MYSGWRRHQRKSLAKPLSYRSPLLSEPGVAAVMVRPSWLFSERIASGSPEVLGHAAIGTWGGSGRGKVTWPLVPVPPQPSRHAVLYASAGPPVRWQVPSGL